MHEHAKIIADALKDMNDARANLTLETQKEGFAKFWNAVDRLMSASSERARIAQQCLMKDFMQAIADGLREQVAR